MAEASRPNLIRSLPVLGGGAAGLLVAVVALALPGDWLEGFVASSGIAALLPVAAPPLGATARVVLGLGGGLAIAAVVWAALYLLVGPGGPLAAPRKRTSEGPTVRRADRHPDAPPRRPLGATDLPPPPPPMLPPVEQPLPRDLGLPLASFDPDALLPVPAEAIRPVKPLAPVLAPGERLETFTLAPPPPPSAPTPRRDEPPSIDALLRRLERGAERRAAGAR